MSKKHTQSMPKVADSRFAPMLESLIAHGKVEEDDLIDSLLGICATYGTSVLGTNEQEHFLEGFKASQTYQEAKALLKTYWLSKSDVIKAIGPNETHWVDHFGDEHNVHTDSMNARNELRRDIVRKLNIQEGGHFATIANIKVQIVEIELDCGHTRTWNALVGKKELYSSRDTVECSSCGTPERVHKIINKARKSEK